MNVLMALVAVVTLSATLYAQRLSPVAFPRPMVAAQAAGPSPGVRGQQYPAVVPDPVLTRALTAGFGMVVGTVAGLAIANGVSDECMCDDPGLNEFVAGFFLGGTTGAAIGAAIPSFERGCSGGERFARG